MAYWSTNGSWLMDDARKPQKLIPSWNMVKGVLGSCVDNHQENNSASTKL
jgi:hypothetical protein